MHEYLTTYSQSYGQCVECNKRTPHTCFKCHYCYSCHPKVERIEKEQEILAKHYHRRYTDRQQPEKQDEVTYVIYRIKR